MLTHHDTYPCRNKFATRHFFSNTPMSLQTKRIKGRSLIQLASFRSSKATRRSTKIREMRARGDQKVSMCRALEGKVIDGISLFARCQVDLLSRCWLLVIFPSPEVPGEGPPEHNAVYRENMGNQWRNSSRNSSSQWVIT